LLDIPRCPRLVRDGALDYLQFVIRFGGVYAPVASVLAQSLASQHETRVVDCCSGGGGPWPELRSLLIKAGASPLLTVLLTDAYPNSDAFRVIHAAHPLVAGTCTPVDVARGAMQLPGMRTLFSSFHHFRPGEAEHVLRNLTAHGDGVFIAEVTERRWRAILFMLLAPLFVWCATPMLRPFRWSRLALTYLLPLIPLVVCFDGIVSCLRTYSPDELRELLSTVSDLPYDWEVGQAQGTSPMAVTYALGLPRRAP
jgi:hypothetical protein